MVFTQLVVGQPEPAGGKQIAPIPIVGKSPRLPHQPVDHVPVLDPVLAPPPQPRQLLHPLLGVPHFQPLGIKPHLHPLPDQAARHRVHIARHPDDAAALDPHPDSLARLQTTLRQRPQPGQFLRQTVSPTRIAAGEQLPQESPVRLPTGEVPTASQEQFLLQPPLQLAMALLTIAVLMSLPSVDRLSSQTIVPQQRLIPLLEHLRLRLAGLHGRRQPIGPMHLRHAAQFPQGVLQALAEAFQALRKTERPRLPVRIGQHEVVHQVRKRRTGDRHAQLGAVREVRGTQPSGLVNLGEEHLLGGTVLGPPPLDPPLQGPQLPLGEATRVLPLQGLEKSLGLQARSQGQLFLDPGPDVGKGIESCPPGVVHTHLAGQSLEPPVLAGGLVGHAGLARRLLLGESLESEAAKGADLLIGNHAGTSL